MIIWWWIVLSDINSEGIISCCRWRCYRTACRSMVSLLLSIEPPCRTQWCLCSSMQLRRDRGAPIDLQPWCSPSNAVDPCRPDRARKWASILSARLRDKHCRFYRCWGGESCWGTSPLEVWRGIPLWPWRRRGSMSFCRRIAPCWVRSWCAVRWCCLGWGRRLWRFRSCSHRTSGYRFSFAARRSLDWCCSCCRAISRSRVSWPWNFWA